MLFTHRLCQLYERNAAATTTTKITIADRPAQVSQPIAFRLWCAAILFWLYLILLTCCMSLYIIVTYGIRAADPPDPHDLIRSIRVMRWVLHAVCRMAAGRWAGEIILFCICIVYTVRYRSTCINPSPVRAQLLSIIWYIGISGIHYRIGYCTIVRINLLYRISLYQYIYISI